MELRNGHAGRERWLVSKAAMATHSAHDVNWPEDIEGPTTDELSFSANAAIIKFIGQVVRGAEPRFSGLTSANRILSAAVLRYI